MEAGGSLSCRSSCSKGPCRLKCATGAYASLQASCLVGTASKQKLGDIWMRQAMDDTYRLLTVQFEILLWWHERFLRCIRIDGIDSLCDISKDLFCS